MVQIHVSIVIASMLLYTASNVTLVAAHFLVLANSLRWQKLLTGGISYSFVTYFLLSSCSQLLGNDSAHAANMYTDIEGTSLYTSPCSLCISLYNIFAVVSKFRTSGMTSSLQSHGVSSRSNHTSSHSQRIRRNHPSRWTTTTLSVQDGHSEQYHRTLLTLAPTTYLLSRPSPPWAIGPNRRRNITRAPTADRQPGNLTWDGQCVRIQFAYWISAKSVSDDGTRGSVWRVKGCDRPREGKACWLLALKSQKRDFADSKWNFWDFSFMHSSITARPSH